MRLSLRRLGAPLSRNGPKNHQKERIRSNSIRAIQQTKPKPVLPSHPLFRNANAHTHTRTHTHTHQVGVDGASEEREAEASLDGLEGGGEHGQRTPSHAPVGFRVAPVEEDLVATHSFTWVQFDSFGSDLSRIRPSQRTGCLVKVFECRRDQVGAKRTVAGPLLCDVCVRVCVSCTSSNVKTIPGLDLAAEGTATCTSFPVCPKLSDRS